jgi:CheY-like chemotaxis protein
MILIVEDHADARQALVKLIKRVGHEVIGVADGAQALLFVRTTLPELIILDYDMPIVDGLEVLRQLRAEPRTANVPVVFFTAASSGLMREQAMAAGAQEYIRKGSMDWMQIVACIERYVRPNGDRAKATST